MASGSEKFPGHNASLGNSNRTLLRHALSPQDFRTLGARDIARNEFFGATSQAISFNAEPAAYVLTGASASLFRALSVNAAASSYALTGSAAAMSRGFSFNAEPSSHALTGADVAFLRVLSINAESSSYALTGSSATMLRTLITSLDAGSLSLTGSDATLLAPYRIESDAGSFAIIGADAELTYASGQGPSVYPGSGIGVGVPFAPWQKDKKWIMGILAGGGFIR